MAVYSPAVSNALEDGYVARNREDPITYTTFLPLRWDGKFGVVPDECEIMALIKGRVASAQYGQTYNCISGLAVGDPVYFDSDNHIAKALATGYAAQKVVGFIRSKATTTTAMISHYVYISGLSSGVAGNPIYLSNAGGLSRVPGTEPKIIGTFISTTEAILHADPLAAQEMFSNAAVRLFNFNNFI